MRARRPRRVTKPNLSDAPAPDSGLHRRHTNESPPRYSQRGDLWDEEDAWSDHRERTSLRHQDAESRRSSSSPHNSRGPGRHVSRQIPMVSGKELLDEYRSAKRDRGQRQTGSHGHHNEIPYSIAPIPTQRTQWHDRTEATVTTRLENDSIFVVEHDNVHEKAILNKLGKSWPSQSISSKDGTSTAYNILSSKRFRNQNGEESIVLSHFAGPSNDKRYRYHMLWL